MIYGRDFFEQDRLMSRIHRRQMIELEIQNEDRPDLTKLLAKYRAFQDYDEDEEE